VPYHYIATIIEKKINAYFHVILSLNLNLSVGNRPTSNISLWLKYGRNTLKKVSDAFGKNKTQVRKQVPLMGFRKNVLTEKPVAARQGNLSPLSELKALYLIRG
jgi:hypothetical protein